MKAPTRTRTLPAYICALFLFATSLPAAEPFTILWKKVGYICGTFSPDDNTILAGTQSGRVDVLNAATSATNASFQAATAFIHRIEFSPNGGLFSVISGERNFKIFRASDRTIRFTQPARSQLVPVTFSPDSSQFAVGDGTNITLYSSVTGDIIRSWNTTNSPLNTLQFMSDGKRLASGTGTRNIKVSLEMWDTATGERLWHQRTFQEYGVHTLALSPDGKLLATGARYLHFPGYLQLWHTHNGALAHTFYYNAYSVSFSPQAPALLTLSSNLTLVALPPSTILEKTRAASPSNREEVRFNNAGTRFLTAGNGTLTCYLTPRRFTHIERIDSTLLLRWITPDLNTTIQTTDLTHPWTNIAPNLTATSHTLPTTEGLRLFRLSN